MPPSNARNGTTGAWWDVSQNRQAVGGVQIIQLPSGTRMISPREQSRSAAWNERTTVNSGQEQLDLATGAAHSSRFLDGPMPRALCADGTGADRIGGALLRCLNQQVGTSDRRASGTNGGGAQQLRYRATCSVGRWRTGWVLETDRNVTPIHA